MYNFRTDLAVERREILEGTNKTQIPGIDAEEEQVNEKLKISRIKVTSEEGEQAIRKTNAEPI